MKDFLHKPVTLDSFFKEKLAELPVDVTGSDLQWQSIKQKVKQGPPQLPGAGALTIGVVVFITMLLLWKISYKNNEVPTETLHNGSSQVPIHQNHQDVTIEKKNPETPAASPGRYREPVNQSTNNSDPANEQLIPASPIFSLTEQKVDSAKRIFVAIRPDSSKRSTLPEIKKDSLFIFW